MMFSPAWAQAHRMKEAHVRALPFARPNHLRRDARRMAHAHIRALSDADGQTG